MFENIVMILLMAMKGYNSNTSEGKRDEACQTLLQYQQAKAVMENHNWKIEVETTPIDSEQSVTGKDFLFTQLKLDSHSVQEYPSLKIMGFVIDGNEAVYTFKPKGW